MSLALLLICLGNLCFGVWSHKTLGTQVRQTREALHDAISGRIREIGPIEAQTTALKAQAVERATARRARPATLNL